jgi:hypothetical protein
MRYGELKFGGRNVGVSKNRASGGAVHQVITDCNLGMVLR